MEVERNRTGCPAPFRPAAEGSRGRSGHVDDGGRRLYAARDQLTESVRIGGGGGGGGGGETKNGENK